MTPPSASAPEAALNQGLSPSRKRKRRTEPVEGASKKLRYHAIKNRYTSTTSRHGSAFWDLLETICLTQHALDEFDRRDALIPRPEPPKINHRKRKPQLNLCVKQFEPGNLPDLKQFSCTGGPDLTDVRGYPPRSSVVMPRGRKSAMPPPAKGQGHMGPPDPPSTMKRNLEIISEASRDTDKTEKTNAYDINFEILLANRGITQPDPDNIPDNKVEWLERLEQERLSNSVSDISDEKFREFQRVVVKAHNKPKVMKHIYPYLRGDDRVDNSHIGQQNRPCANWEPLTKDEALVTPQPDLFDGIGELSYPQLRAELSKSIVPAVSNSPSLPNCFVEFKSPEGTSGCAERQACYDGAFGARGIHQAQNYGKKPGEEVYDNKAYTISFTYVGGHLEAYLHFMSKPRSSVDDVQYKMYLLDGWSLRGNIRDFKRGVTAFRNARDTAREFREKFAEEASEKVKQTTPTSEWLRLGNLGPSFNEKVNEDSGDDIPSLYDSQASYLDGEEASQPHNRDTTPTNSDYAEYDTTHLRKRQKSTEASKPPTNSRPITKVAKPNSKFKKPDGDEPSPELVRKLKGLR